MNLQERYFCHLKTFNRAIYPGIKNLSFSSHSLFLLEVARQLPLNTAKNPNRKTHLRSVVFETPPVFQFFCQCKRSLPSHWYYSGLWSRGTRSLQNHPWRTAHYVRSKVERSWECAPLTKKPVWDSGFFAHALFLPKTEKLWVFLAV